MILNQKNKIFIFRFAYIILLILGFLYSVNFYTYIYDGYHHGLIYSFSKDLINGQMPYKNIWLTYGIIQPIINSFFLFFYDNLITLQIVTISFYYLGIFFLYKIGIKFFGNNYSLATVIIIILNHPVPHNIWPNYYAFFFITLSFYILTFKNNYKFLYSGIVLGLTPLIRTEFFYVLTIYASVLFFLNFFKKETKYNFGFYILGLFIPFLLFFFFLISNNLVDIWLDYLNIYKYFIVKYEVTKLTLIINFLKFYSYQSFFNIINEPQYIIISIILILNFFFLFCLLKKNIFIFKVSLFSLISLILCLQAKQLMNPYTSIIVGITPLVYIFVRMLEKDFKRIFIYSILIVSLYSFFVFIKNPADHVELFKSIDFKVKKNTENKISYFSHSNWPDFKNFALNEYYNQMNIILANCNIKYFDNLTSDTFFSISSKLPRMRLIPYITLNKISNLDDEFNKNYEIKINAEIRKENIVLLVDERLKTSILLDDKLYNKYYIKFNNEKKPRYYFLYYPLKCK